MMSVSSLDEEDCKPDSSFSADVCVALCILMRVRNFLHIAGNMNLLEKDLVFVELNVSGSQLGCSRNLF